MMEKEALFRAAIHYYCFNGLPKMMQSAAIDGLRIFTSDGRFRFYHAVSLHLEGRSQEALRELVPLQDDQALGVAVIMALIHTHRACKSVDRDEVAKYESKLKEKRKQMEEISSYYAAIFSLLVGRLDRAREYGEKMVKMGSNLKERASLLGWLQLLSLEENSEVSPSAGEYFEAGVRMKDPDSILGKAKFYERSGSFSKGIEVLNTLIVGNPNFLPSLIEKMKLQVALKDWDQAVDTAQRALAVDRHCIEAQRYLIIYELAWMGSEESAIQRISDLGASLDIREPKNASFLNETGKLLNRLACGRRPVLNQAFSMCEKAVLIESGRVDLLIELGNQCISMGRLVEARRHFNSAIKLSESNFEAAMGLLHCSILEDPRKASEQMETMEELHRSTGMPKELLYLSAIWFKNMATNQGRADECLENIVEKHQHEMKAQPLGLRFYIKLDADFIIRVLKLLLDSAPTEPAVKGQVIEPRFQKCKEMIQIVVASCPGLSQPLFLMANTLYLCGDSRAALCYLNKVADRDENSVERLLLHAKILVSNGSFQIAANALELALGQNFEIREQLKFILVKVEILRHQGENDEALKILDNLLTSSKKSNSRVNLSNTQKVDILLEMTRIYLLKYQINNAENILEDLLTQHRGTLEEGRILIAKAKLSESRGKIEEAISSLRDIPAQKSGDFVKSREIMANLYLKHRRDRRLYIGCYKEILDKNNQTQSYLMLGDAYMNILEPEKAIDIYEQALKKNPKDGILIRRVGQALIKTHLFEKAITYYKAALKSSPDHDLRHDLSLLLYRLKRLSEAEAIVRQALEIVAKDDSRDQDLALMEWEAKMVHLLSQIQISSGKKEEGIETLQKAHEMFLRVFRRVSVERPDSESTVKKAATEVSISLAQQFVNHQRDHEKAIETYKKILVFDPENISILTALERLEIARDNLEEARKYSSLILKKAPNDRESLLMTTDLMFRRNDFEGALSHVQHVMDSMPCFYLALARLVEAARRTGKLDAVKEYIDKAADSSPRAESETGFNYCKGLYSWYRGELDEAIKCFNRSRSDVDFGLMASYHMIEIFIGSESESVGGLSFESLNNNLNSLELVGAPEAAIRRAQKLLAEIQDIAGDDLDYHIMGNFVLLSSHQKSDGDLALGEFIRILNDPRYKDHPGALLGIASAYLVLKQAPKARSHLKKVMRSEWNYPNAEYLERCWLLLADIYTQSGKYESAQELLRRVLTYNKSCVKAHGNFGFIMDKSQNYKEAIMNYEVAWKLQDSNNPTIGFKLAVDYMKCKRYVDAIDVGRAILTKFPEYPRVQKDIIDKCRNHLKN